MGLWIYLPNTERYLVTPTSKGFWLLLSFSMNM